MGGFPTECTFHMLKCAKPSTENGGYVEKTVRPLVPLSIADITVNEREMEKNELKDLLQEEPALGRLVQTVTCSTERTTILKCDRSDRMRRYDGHRTIDWRNHGCFYCDIQMCKQDLSACNCGHCTRTLEWRAKLERICGKRNRRDAIATPHDPPSFFFYCFFF